MTYIAYSLRQDYNQTVDQFLTQEFQRIPLRNDITLNLSYAHFNSREEFHRVFNKIAQHRVTRIDLSSTSMNDEDAIIVANAIQVHQYMLDVALCKNFIQARGALALAAAIQYNPRLNINLTDNNIGTHGAAAYVEAFTQTTQNTIDLSNNNLGDEGAVAIAAKLNERRGEVTNLVLKQNQIGDVGDRALAGLPREIKVVYRTSIVPYMKAHPYLSTFLIIVFFPLIFVLPFVKSEKEIEGCKHQAQPRRNVRMVSYLEAYPYRSLFMIVVFFPLMFILPFLKVEQEIRN